MIQLLFFFKIWLKMCIKPATSDCGIRSVLEINVNITFILLLYFYLYSVLGSFVGRGLNLFHKLAFCLLLFLKKVVPGLLKYQLREADFYEKDEGLGSYSCYVGADLRIQGLEVQQR